jgi:hypothetical protein
MATRGEAMKYLRDINGMKEGDDGFFSYVMSWAEDGRSQLVFLKVLDEFIILTSAFADKDDITAHKALDLASGSFGVADMGGHYALRHVIFLEDLDESEIVNGITWLAGQADTLESRVGGDAL